MDFSDVNAPLLLALIAFLVICLLAMGILIYIRNVNARRQMIRKIITDEEEWTTTRTDAPSVSSSKKSTNPLVNLLGAIGLKTNPKKSTDDFQLKLKFQRAGLRGRNVPSIFWGTKLLLAAALPITSLFIAVTFFNPVKPSHTLLIVIFLAMLGLILPDIWLSVRTSKRMKRLVRGFPDALDLLVVCVEAGMGLDAAINKVGEEVGFTHPDLGEELKIVNLELRAGKARQHALRSLADRTGIEEVKNFVTLLIQTDRFGTSVARALRVYSDAFRTSRYQRAEEIAAKIATKLLFPLVLFLFPCIFVVVMGPVVIQVYRLVLNR
jgi:tight adherence protein C